MPDLRWAFVVLLAAAALSAAEARAEPQVRVLNAQSYPQVGGLWTVHFEASGGPADLSVEGSGGTSMWGPGADVSFERLDGPAGHGARQGDRLVFAEAEPGAFKLAVRVHTPGEHHLLVSFGGAEAHAHNSAYPAYTTKLPGSLGAMLPLRDNAQFGQSLAIVGDFDRNGVPDLVGGVNDAAGQSGSRGALQVVFMNSDGTAKSITEISGRSANGPSLADGDKFGSSVSDMGDLDGDGMSDLAAGASEDDEGGTNRGAVHVLFMNRDGTVKKTAEINGSTANGPSLADYALFGTSVSGIGDLDGDRIPDLAAGAPWSGEVHVMFMNRDGTVKSTTKIDGSTANGPSLGSFDLFGISVAGIGDLDGDGIPDIAAGATLDDEGGTNRGAVHVMFMNRDGTVKSTVKIDSSTANGPSLSNADNFGRSVLDIGDVDGDRIPDLAAGAPEDDAGGAGRGAVHVMLMNRDGTVKRTAEINDITPDGPSLADNDKFGFALAVRRSDGGTTDLAAGAYAADTAGPNSGAVYSIRLRADGTAQGTVEIGRTQNRDPVLAAGDGFGTSVAGIGDVDGDGIPDVAAGAPEDDAGGIGRGAVHVMLMNSDGTARRTIEINGGTPDGPLLANFDRFGRSVSGIGDLDGDGIPDIAAGATGDDAGGQGRGALHVMLLNRDGGVKLTAEISNATPNGPSLADHDMFGASVSGIGDLDGDGVPDLAAGATGDDAGGAGRGALHILFMNRDGTVKRTAEISSSTANGPSLADSDAFGRSVSGIGDLDGDGTPDIASGTPLRGSAGAVYVLFMNGGGTVKRTVEITGATPGGPPISANDQFGTSVSGLGDIDGDGIPDMAAGAPGAQVRGAVHIMLMQQDGTPGRSYEMSHGTPGGPSLAANDQFGASVSGVGDVNGDGTVDIAAGAPGDDSGGPGRGAVYVIGLEGSAARGNGAVETAAKVSASSSTRVSVGSSSRFGSGTAGIGDIDGDGIPDLAAGAPEDDEGGADRGAVHVMLMNRDGTVKRATEINSSTANGPSLADSDMFGASVSGIGDMDRDGIPDLAAGAPGDDAGGAGRGALHILFMNRDGTVKRTAEINSSTINGPSLSDSDQFGASVSGIGDLDRDGIPDLAAGAPGDDAGGTGRGAVHVMFMNRDGTVKRTLEINSTANGPSLSDSDQFGASVSGIGDLDRDGIPDLAAGAPGDDEGGTGRGAVHVMFMNRDGTVKRTAEISSSTANGPSLADSDMFGASVSGIGDMDRDGIPDLAAGAPGDDAGGTGRGAVHVMFMKRDGAVQDTAEINGLASPGPVLADSDGFGYSVAGAGDLDGDGAYDIAAGARGAESGSGAVHVMLMDKDPAAVHVSTETADGAYGQGTTIDIVVEFSEPVSVTGVPRMVLETGASDRAAAYRSGSGTSELVFRYVAGYGDASADLDYASMSSLELNGGAIRASQGRAADAALDLPRPGSPGSLSHGRSIVIDAVRPDLASPAPRLDLDGRLLVLSFDKTIDASEMDLSGVTISTAPGAAPVSLAGATPPSQDARSFSIGLTREQKDRVVLGMNAPGYASTSMTVSGAAMHDLLGNYYAGASSRALAVDPDTTAPALEGTPEADFVAGTLSLDFDEIMDSSGISLSGVRLSPPSGSPSVSLAGATANSHVGGLLVISFTDAHNDRLFSEGLATGGPVRLDVPAGAVSDMSGNSFAGLSDSRPRGHYLARPADAPATDEAVRAYRSETSAADAPQFSDHTIIQRFDLLVSDSPSVSDSARFYPYRAKLVDSPAVSDSASHASMLVASVSDSPAFSDSAHARMSASITTGLPVLSDSARAFKSATDVSDAPSLSDSAVLRGMLARHPSDAAAISDSMHAYKSGAAPSDAPALSDSASRTSRSVRALSDTAVISDSARAYQSGAVLYDSPALSDSALHASMLVQASSDTAVISDSARSYQSGAALSDSPAFSDSASRTSRSVRALSDTAVLSDSARAYQSGAVLSDSPSLADSSSHAGMLVQISSDTAVISDSARAYQSGAVLSDTPAFSDNADLQGMLIRISSDTAVISDSVRAYQSGAVISDAPSLSDSASHAGMLVQASSDTAVISDSVRAYQSGSALSDSPALSDSASSSGMLVQSLSDEPSASDSAGAYKSGAVSSDSPALSDSASHAGMLVQGVSDAPTVSDSVRAYQSGSALSDSPALSDSASSSGMLVQSLSDEPSASDSAGAYKSGAVSSDSPALSDSASYAGMLVQGISDSPAFSDSARVYGSGLAPSDSPAVSDSASALAAFASRPSDSPSASDSARTHKSAFASQSVPAMSDNLRWGSMSAAASSDSPSASDSARAYKSAAAAVDAPLHEDDVRGGASRTVVRDSPALSDGAVMGQPMPPVSIDDEPAAHDGALFSMSKLPTEEAGGAGGREQEGAEGGSSHHDTSHGSGGGGSGSSGGGGGSGRSGGAGAPLATVHGASWNRCSEDPHVLIVAGPDCRRVSVALSQQGGLAVAQLTDEPGSAPGSCVWRAPMSPDAREVQIRATHARTSVSDDRTLATEPCSGRVSFTGFAAPQPAGAPDDGGAGADLVPAKAPKAGAVPEAVPEAEPELPTEPAPPAGQGSAALPDLKVEPRAQGADLDSRGPAPPAVPRPDAGAPAWAAAAVVLAAAGAIAALYARRRAAR